MKKLIFPAIIAIAAFTGCNKSNNDLTDNSAAQIPVTANFSVDNRDNIKEGTAAQFRSASSNGISYQWNFGNGHSSSEKSPAYTYPVCGAYTVTLSVTDAAGNVKTETQQLNVDCIFRNTPQQGNHPALF